MPLFMSSPFRSCGAPLNVRLASKPVPHCYYPGLAAPILVSPPLYSPSLQRISVLGPCLGTMAERLAGTDGLDTESFARGHGSTLPANHQAPTNTATLRAAVPVRSARDSNSPVTTPPSRKNENIVAVYVQISGKAPVRKCEQCIEAGDNTKWGVCVVAVDADGQAKTKGACACCHYNKYGHKCSFRNGQAPQFDNDEVRESGDRDGDGNGDNPEDGDTVRARMLVILTKQYAAKSEEDMDAAQLDYLQKMEEADTHLKAIERARASREEGV
ncbi:hypothetical protein DL771_008377 [Monosporascus sp. 5C6A]|nr:hypothetical protein DL771_008377 [Monosporascus sp. 5C6A]